MKMNDEIIEVIAKHFPYSAEEIKKAYEACHSFDLLLSACVAARDAGETSPLEAVRYIQSFWEDKPKVPHFP